MIEKAFWKAARDAWIVNAPPKIVDVKTGLGGKIDPSLLKDPWELEEVPFDMVDHDRAFEAVLAGEDIPLNSEYINNSLRRIIPGKQHRARLNVEQFDELIEKQSIPEYVSACKLLRACDLPVKMNELYDELIERMPVLQDAVYKFEGVYHADMSQFYEYYIPEALQLTATYIEYLDVGIGEDIIKATEIEVIEACEKLLIAINDKIDEIYKFASIEIKAKAKALESMMGQDGYVNPDYKINQNGGK
ncbi:hypothetical protein [Butyrivibrio sp. MC2013]|uniref:hypothetical protein n=1 Tax=Butyrivibrio sp. MC2013 TaxID=1280686 RepID=UPI00040D826C|nr:hypothetical protein [Butyrivibrio sp. MC2013]